MVIAIHKSATRLARHRERLLVLKQRVEQQMKDSEFLISALDDYCKECPIPPCASNDPAWRQQLTRQHENLAAMRLGIRERLKRLPS
jgi:hypothetical protein